MSKQGGRTVVQRLFARVPPQTVKAVQGALAATATVRERVRPELERARAIAEQYAQLDDIARR